MVKEKMYEYGSVKVEKEPVGTAEKIEEAAQEVQVEMEQVLVEVKKIEPVVEAEDLDGASLFLSLFLHMALDIDKHGS